MRKLSGFTLIELLIVVAIIAILAAIAVPNFLEAQTRAKVSRAKADLRTLAVAAESYYVDNNAYPYTLSIGTSIWMPAGGFPPNGLRCGGMTSPIAYITTIPRDPFGHGINDDGTFSQRAPAPLYMEKAGFGFKTTSTVPSSAIQPPGGKTVNVPSDTAGSNSLLGTSNTSTPVADMWRTPRRWVMYSLGPDLTPHVTDRPTPQGTILSNSRYNLNNRYDPTNGTISTGNVLRFDDGMNVP